MSSSSIAFSKSISASSSAFLLNKFENLKSTTTTTPTNTNTNSTKENSHKVIDSPKSMLLENLPENFFHQEASKLAEICHANKTFLTTLNTMKNFLTPPTNLNLTAENLTKKQRNLSFDELKPLTAIIAEASQSSTSSTSSLSFASTFIEAQELKRKLLELPKFIVILLDCRTYTDFNLKHIKDSVHLNCRDKLIKKRLQTRKLTVKDLISNEDVKNKLDSNEDCLINNVRAAASASFTQLVNNSSKILNRLATCTNGTLNRMISDDSEEISNLNLHDNFKDSVKLSSESFKNCIRSMNLKLPTENVIIFSLLFGITLICGGL